MSHSSQQLPLFPADAIEQRLQEILARRRLHNASGQEGEDAAQILAALSADFDRSSLAPTRIY